MGDWGNAGIEFVPLKTGVGDIPDPSLDVVARARASFSFKLHDIGSRKLCPEVVSEPHTIADYGGIVPIAPINAIGKDYLSKTILSALCSGLMLIARHEALKDMIARRVQIVELIDPTRDARAGHCGHGLMPHRKARGKGACA